jgi:hypothetical protein
MKKFFLYAFSFFIFLTALLVPTTLAQDHQAGLSSLTLAEQHEFEAVRDKAMLLPAVQSTRRLVRMALHQAMLQADPALDTIFADMNAHTPNKELKFPHHKKYVGIQFASWLANYPPASIAFLTPADRQKLKLAHQKALQDPNFIAASKTARITFYNAMINVYPKIMPILTKAGIPMPSSIRKAAINSKIGSEEKILGDNDAVWDAEILVPTVEKTK